MTMTTTIIRDTETSFIKITKDCFGQEFLRKIEKGGVDYSNACMVFHSANVSLSKGNKVTF